MQRPSQHLPLLRAVALGWFALCTLVLLILSRHWPLVNDAALMHYVAFLIDHGLRPYRDILDPNLPGSYLLDWAVIHTLGPDPGASRLYDLLLLAAGSVAMLATGWHRDRIAALIAACLFALFHGRDGMAQLAQRDLALSIALLIAVALASYLARHPSLPAAACLGLTIGTATTIKPYALLFFLLLIPVASHVKQARRTPLLLALSGALLLPLLMTALYLVHNGSVQAFLFTLLTLDPLHQRLGNPGLRYLLTWCLPPSLFLLSALGLAALRLNPSPVRSIERQLLLLGILIGLAAYLIQLKGFPYHRYPLVACLLLFLALEAGQALRHPGLPRIAGALALLVAAVIAPLYAIHGLHARWPNDMETALEADLTRNGGSALSGHIQCIDSIEGCTRVLYDMRLVEGTGMLYDEFLFLDHPPATVVARRDQFLAALQSSEPTLIIITPDLFLSTQSPHGQHYAKLLLWPDLQLFLNRCYDQTIERTFPSGAPNEPGYRIYRAAAHCRT